MRGSQGHDLADRDGDVCVLRGGLIAPAAFAILCVDDQADGELEFFFNVRARGHAIHFGEEERGEAVAVHGRAVILRGDEPGFLAVVEGEVEDFVDFLAVGSVVGEISVGDKSNAGEGHDGRGIAAGGVDGAVGVEIFGKEFEAFFDAGAEGGGEFVFDGGAADGGGVGEGWWGGGGEGLGVELWGEGCDGDHDKEVQRGGPRLRPRASRGARGARACGGYERR